ncbi:sensor histidine kinase [Natranaerobius thermophilus]|uniref:Oxygen sensor histidine kinase NreB n=2 Tax=Natranaerobius TaxID=375928 RepID=B2A8K7_NATTJ|nr:sensor histidine kinase [Natranaerobius thermophilus]ACB85891.1 histidine kinase [Natranaerobius thermophilus JW/NM-WN-LF]
MADDNHFAPSEKVDVKVVDDILEKTIDNIQNGKVQIFEIAESARTEYDQMQQELKEIKNKVREVIQEVDNLEKKCHQAKVHLADVSKHFDTYSEEDIKEAYEQASDLRARLTIMKEREQQLRNHRDSTERRLKNLKKTIEKAENIVNQMGVIENYLSQGLGGLQETLEDLEKRKAIGLKIIRAQEEERRRVAREIHDGPAQNLANMVLRTEYCEKLIDANSGTDEIKEELGELKQQVRTNLKDVRKIIFDLRPMTLDDLGLVPAIRKLIQGVEEESNIEGELKTFGEEKRLNRYIEIALFRTVQEALNNIKKHSGAKRFWVKTDFSNDTIHIIIRDDGKGFNPEDKLQDSEDDSDSEHFGISNMKERVESLGGEINFSSKPKQGTKISIKVPVFVN